MASLFPFILCGPESQSSKQNTDFCELEPEPLCEDLYGVGITSLIRDVNKLATARDDGFFCLRVSKVATTIVVLWLTIAMQVFMMVEFKLLVVQSSVHKIRTTYSQYEDFMYDGMVYVNGNGFSRGLPGFFKKERFADLPTHIDKEFLCSIPFSMPAFFIGVLLVWSFTVVTDIRHILFYADLLTIKTDTIESVMTMLEHRPDHMVVLRGLPLTFKAMLLLFIFLPRLILDIVLLWMGCRWLAATASFSDVLLNAMALEFILLLKDLVYTAVVPRQNQWEERTMLVPHHRTSQPSWRNSMLAFVWLVVVFLWVLLYVYRLQQVLPAYNWDVRVVCSDYIKELTSETNDKALPAAAHGHHFRVHRQR